MDEKYNQLWKTFVTNIMQTLRDMELNMNAQEILLLGMSDAYPDERLMEKLDELKRSPALRGQVRDKYEIPLEKFLQTIDVLGLVPALAELHLAGKKRTPEN